jgi:Domain of unknown function (DUF5659)
MKRDNEQIEKHFTTLDSYTAGYLTLKGFIPHLIQQGSKIVFCFDSSEDLYKALHDYHGGARVQAVRFALAVKTLKSQIHSLRRNKEEYYAEEKARH